MADDRTHAIAARAYEIWERSGRPSGQHDEHWAQAEREILGKIPTRPEGPGNEAGALSKAGAAGPGGRKAVDPAASRQSLSGSR